MMESMLFKKQKPFYGYKLSENINNLIQGKNKIYIKGLLHNLILNKMKIDLYMV